jgi:hypothetical protein
MTVPGSTTTIGALRQVHDQGFRGILGVSPREEGPIEGAVIFVGLVVAVASGAVSAAIATSKGRSGFPYFLLGFFLPLIGILAAGFMAPLVSPQRSQPGDGPGPGDLPLATLRPDGDAKTRAFLQGYKGSVDVALLSCDVGERVLGYGLGFWGGQSFVFVLTDRQFVIVKEGAYQAKSLRDLDGITLSDDRKRLFFLDGAVRPLSSSPFSAAEIASLIQQRHQSPDSVEIAWPGEVAASNSPEPVEPVSDTVGEIERLDTLHRSGAIDDDEFAELKRRAVWGDDGPTESNG